MGSFFRGAMGSFCNRRAAVSGAKPRWRFANAVFAGFSLASIGFVLQKRLELNAAGADSDTTMGAIELVHGAMPPYPSRAIAEP
jgi:hypothetical protein